MCLKNRENVCRPERNGQQRAALMFAWIKGLRRKDFIWCHFLTCFKCNHLSFQSRSNISINIWTFLLTWKCWELQARSGREDRKRVSHPPNLNLLFSPRKTSLCFLRLVLRPAVAMATKLATARARQLIASTFIAHRFLWRSGCNSSISTTSSSMLPLQPLAGRPHRSRCLRDTAGPPRRKARDVEVFLTALQGSSSVLSSGLLVPPLDLSALVCGFVVLSLIKIDMNLFVVVIEEWH